MPKHRLGNYFEDFHLGQKFIHGTPRTITDGDTGLYIALTGMLADGDGPLKQQKNNYYPNTVLDLDYTAILPRCPLAEVA